MALISTQPNSISTAVVPIAKFTNRASANEATFIVGRGREDEPNRCHHRGVQGMSVMG